MATLLILISFLSSSTIRFSPLIAFGAFQTSLLHPKKKRRNTSWLHSKTPVLGVLLQYSTQKSSRCNTSLLHQPNNEMLKLITILDICISCSTLHFLDTPHYTYLSYVLLIGDAILPYYFAPPMWWYLAILLCSSYVMLSDPIIVLIHTYSCGRNERLEGYWF